jgi:hypothetical protein
MGAILDVRRACENRLASITPVVPTFYEGQAAESPNGLYQRCQFNILPPEDPVFPAGYHRERIEFQVFILCKKGEGTGEAYERAELIRNTFYKSLTLLEGTTQIHILRTPSIGTAIPTTDRLVIPVIIGMIAEVYA